MGISFQGCNEKAGYLPVPTFSLSYGFSESGHPLDHGGMRVIPRCIKWVRVEIGKIFRGEFDESRGQGAGETGEFHGKFVRLTGASRTTRGAVSR